MDEELVRERFDRAVKEQELDFETFFLARFFDLTFSYGDQTCRVDIPVADYMHSPRRKLHGGVIMFLFDVSMGHLCRQFATATVTLEISGKYFEPVDEGPAYCVARFLKRGRNIIYAESRLFHQGDRLAAVGSGIFYRRDHPAESGLAAIGR